MDENAKFNKLPRTLENDKLTPAEGAAKNVSRIDEPSLKRSLILHPFSGILILFLDYAFFVMEIPGVTILAAVGIAFVVTFVGVLLIQRYIEEENWGRGVAKAFFSAVITAIPTPVFGTIFGSLILAVSGLNWLSKFFKRN